MLAVAGLALQGCGGDDDERVRVETVEVPVEVPADPEIVEVPVEVPDDSGLEGVQQRAADAAMAAKMASDDAAADAMAAMDATASLATMQTGAMSGMMAYEAKKAADGAMMAYMDAKAASDAAAMATTTEAATEEAVKAEAAQGKAEMYAMTADEKSMGAVKYAMMELMIDGTMKSVGETMIDAMAPKTEVTAGSGADAQTTITGLAGMPMTTGDATDGQVGIAADLAAGTKYQPFTVGAEMRDDLEIGKDVDSADDMARLRIITAYADTQMVNVYAAPGTAATHLSDEEGTVKVADADGAVLTETTLVDTTTEKRTLRLRPVGMFYESGDGTVNFPTDPPTTVDDTAAANMAIDPDTKAKQVYSFVNTAADGDPTVYVVLSQTTATTTAGTTSTVYEYMAVDIHVDINRDGLTDTGTAGNEPVLVTADLPVPKSYSHLHFGVWASLGEAAKDGSQMVTDLGIGFVQNFSGMGMTETMPIRGMLEHEGNWVAAVQEQNDGGIELQTGKAMLTADIDKDTLKADLMGLAMLEGDLSGSMFSGTKVTVAADNMYGLNANGEFTGEFSGGYYGDKAVEAGGTFDFMSEGMADGAFRGAFGGRMMEDE